MDFALPAEHEVKVKVKETERNVKDFGPTRKQNKKKTYYGTNVIGAL